MTFEPLHAIGDVDHPVVAISTDNEGLNQCTEFSYTVSDCGKRTCTTNGPMRRKVRMKLPLLLSPEVWMRHNYSFEDIIDTLNYFKSIHLWQVAMLLGIQLHASSVKLSFSTPSSMVFSSKAIVLVKIANQLKKCFPQQYNAVNVLDRSHEDHVPPLPVHRIDTEEYQTWKRRTPLETDIKMLRPNKVDHVFHWKDIVLVPMWMEGDCIYMVRVVNKEVYEQSTRDTDSISTMPPRFIYQGTMLYGVDEAAFFLPKV